MQIDHQEITSKIDLRVPQTQEMLTKDITTEEAAARFSPALVDDISTFEFNIFTFSEKVGRKL